MSDSNLSLAPFVIGVTGHMESEDEEKLRQKLDRVFSWVVGSGKDEFLGKGLGLENVPILLLSSLAPGVDQLFVEVAREYFQGDPKKKIEPKAENPLEILAPLSFPKPQYEEVTTFIKDGDTAGNDKRLADFREMVGFVGESNLFPVRLAEDVSLSEAKLSEVLKHDKDDRVRRHKRYRAAGEYIASYSDLLVVVTDTSPTDRVSDREDAGAAAIMEVRRTGITPGLLPVEPQLSWADNGPLIYIWHPKKPKKPKPGAPPKKPPFVAQGKEAMMLIHPDDCRPPHLEAVLPSDSEWQEAGRKILTDICERLRHLNEDLRPMSGSGVGKFPLSDMIGMKVVENAGPAPKAEKKKKKWLIREWFEENVLEPLFESTKAKESLADKLWCAVKNFREAFIFRIDPGSPKPMPADLAERFRRRLDSVARVRRHIADLQAKFDDLSRDYDAIFFRLAFAFLLFLQIYELWRRDHAGAGGAWFVASVVLVVAAVGLWMLLVKREIEERQNDYRAIAEGLRVQFYFLASGTGASAAAKYLQRQRGELSWVRSVISGLAFPYEPSQEDFRKLAPRERYWMLESVRSHWVMEQRKYFIRTMKRITARKHSLHALGYSLLWAGLTLALAHYLHHDHHEAVEGLVEWSRDHGFALAKACAALPVLLWLGQAAYDLCHPRKDLLDPKTCLRPPKSHFWQVLFPSFAWLHRKLFEKEHKLRDAVLENLPSIFIGITLAFWVLTFALHGCDSGHCRMFFGLIQMPGASAFVEICKNMALITGGLVHLWIAVRFLNENIRRYDSCASLFHVANLRLMDHLGRLDSHTHDHPHDIEGAEAIIKEIHDLLISLGREALAENTEWLVMHRDRAIQPVFGA